MSKIDRISLIVAGVLTCLGGLFHFTFFEIFNSPQVLECLNHDAWAIVQTLNLGSILFSFMTAYISIVHPMDLVQTRLGRPLLISFSLVYVIRIVSEFVYFGFGGMESILWIALCLILASLYLRVALKRRLIK